MKNLATKEYLKRMGLKNPPIDSGISGGGVAPRIYVSDIMQQYADQQVSAYKQQVLAEIEKELRAKDTDADFSFVVEPVLERLIDKIKEM